MMQLLRGAEVKDGAVTLDAVLAASTKRFEALDRNKDGVVDKADFDLIRKEGIDYRVKRFVHAFGADKDGRITREQFNARAAERFAQLDVNGDGRIGRDEIRGRGRGQDDQDGDRGRRGWFGRGAPQDGPVPGGPGAPPPKKN